MKPKYSLFLLLITPLILSACTKSTSSDDTSKNTAYAIVEKDTTSSEQGVITTTVSEVDTFMNEFNMLISNKDTKVESLFASLANIPSDIPKETVTTMLYEIESFQINNLSTLNKTFEKESIQEAFYTVAEEDLNNVSNIKNHLIIDLVTQTVKDGYKIVTAEGLFYPVIDYTKYKEYTSLASDEAKDYFSIMSLESEKPFAKDAALLIGWDEIIERGLTCEKFLNTYPQSKRIDTIASLYDRYELTAMFGLSNTPLFDSKKVIVEDAKLIYESLLSSDSTSQFILSIKGFFDLVIANDGALSQEAEDYRTSFFQ